VRRVHTVIEEATSAGDRAETRIEAIVSLDDPDATAGIEVAVVTVVFVAAQRPNVLTVPVAALVALAQGGYGLEVIDGSRTRYLRVDTGLFAGGRVEVSGDGLAEGMTVGMPQ
jgi:multidrug efflux pump subunit AcrA (membrane-fusion protein)